MLEDGGGRTAAVFRAICTTTRTVCSRTMWRGVGWSRSTEAALSPLSSFTSFVCVCVCALKVFALLFLRTARLGILDNAQLRAPTRTRREVPSLPPQNA